MDISLPQRINTQQLSATIIPLIGTLLAFITMQLAKSLVQIGLWGGDRES